ncbi:acetate kinase [Ideonella sp. DXS22W]|uniref:Acetate kinase n=1 Tax=Pseudaquabacterium inlustre TaxID=2984192 RepID=A0ABU9CH49_9BURK
MSVPTTPDREPLVLAVNAGSSSLKFGLYAAQGPARLVGQCSGLEPGGTPRWQTDAEPAAPLPLAAGQTPWDAALGALLALLHRTHVGEREAGAPGSAGAGALLAVAHRIVHGGSVCTAPVLLDEAHLAALAELSPLAPLHQPHNLAGVAAFRRALPSVPQVGCFDTAFHATLPPLERRLPLPGALDAQGLRRYGFHGLSYQYLSETLAARTPRSQGRALLMHLGSGASLCATLQGRSVATTMGFSALDGLMMGTRCGSLDPGVLLHLWRAGRTLDEVEALLYRDSGLKGVSGRSADLRTLRALVAAGGDGAADAALAIDLFTHRIVREAGALVALMGGVDLVAFTGGIGEHDAALRAGLAQRLGFLGLRIDAARNHAATGEAIAPVHAGDSTAELWVVPTDEGRVAARSAFSLLRA